MASRSRHQRHFSPLDERYLIDTLGDARQACVQASGKVEINGDIYRALHKVQEAIDDLAVATGRKRDHFWLKPHSI
jgi:hypothetical protein